MQGSEVNFDRAVNCSAFRWSIEHDVSLAGMVQRREALQLDRRGPFRY